MGNGYLGKISAIVTANTGDFKPKLDAAAKDVSSFAKTMQSTLTSASTASSTALRGIYTEAQKFERAVKAATTLKLSFKGFDAATLADAASRMRQLYSATNQITQPLAEASKSFGKLSADVQGAFLPALISAQKATESLSNAIRTTGDVGDQRFDSVKRKIDGVVASMNRLREAEGLVNSLSTGRELAFQQPGMTAEFARAKALQSKSLALAPDALSGSSIAGLVVQQKAAADEVARLYANLEKVRNSRDGDTAAATAALNAQLGLYSQLNTQIEKEIDAIERLAAAKKRDAEIDQNIGASSRRATPVGGLIKMRAEEERRKRDDEIERNIGASSQRATPISALLRMRAEEDRRRRDAIIDQNIGASSKFATPVAALLRQRADDERRKRDEEIENNIGASSKRMTSVSDLLRLRANEEIAQNIGASSRFATPIASLLRQRRDEEIARNIGASTPYATPVADLLRRRRDEEIARNIGASTPYATPIANLLRMREDDARRARDAEIAQNIGASSRYATPVAGLLRQRRDEEIARNIGASSQFATPVGNLIRLRYNEEISRNIGSMSQRASVVDLAGNAERAARSRMGGAIAGGAGAFAAQLDVGRQVDAVADRVAAARAQLESLPDPLRMALIPALQRATDAAANLARSGFGATAVQIRAAATEAARLEQQVNRSRRAETFTAQFGRAGGGGLDFSLQERSLQGYTAQLQVLHQTLSTAAGAARGPAVAAFDRLRSYISRAFREGRLDAELARGEIRRLTQEAVTATAAAANVRAGALGRHVGRAGDIGRMGFGNAGLAIQQASFAVSDFMSTTGGLEFRIRAISNNIEQLGFVLGGTYGLVAAVGVSVVTNLGLMAARFAGLMDTEEQVRSRTDAVTDAFSRQKTAVESLAESYAKYSEELRRSILAKDENTAIDRRQEAEGTLKKQQESRDAFASVTLPEMLALQSRRKEIEARNPSTIQEAQAKQADLSENDRLQQRALQENRNRGQDALRRLGPAGVGLLLNQQTALRDRLLGQRAAPGADVADIDRQLTRANRNIALASDALSTLRGNAVAAVRSGVDPIRDSIEEAMTSAEKLRAEFEDLVPKETTDELAAAATGIQRLLDSAQKGELIPGEGLNKMIAEATAAANAPIEKIKAAQAQLEPRKLLEDRRNEAAQEIEQSAQRGRGLAMSSGQKAGEELVAGLLDISRALANPAEAQKRFAQERMRSAAPAIFGLADSVENALMQGPSRAALQANDITTSQGAAELNRLLRGDDSAKNQDLVELQRQSKDALVQLVEYARQNGAPPGIFD